MPTLRVASLLAAGTEILYALGSGECVVAVSHECDYPPEVARKPRVTRANVRSEESSKAIDDHVRQLAHAGRPLYEIDVPQLAALAPHLIVTQSPCEVCAVSSEMVLAAIAGFDSLKSARVVSLNPTSLERIFDDIRRVGEATGSERKAADYVALLERRTDSVRRVTEGIPVSRHARVLCIEWIEPLMVAANWMPDLVHLAGGINGLTKPGERSRCAAWSDAVAFDPEVIVIAPCGFDLPRTLREAVALRSLPGWGRLSAVQNRRVFAADGNAYFNRSGPRIVDSLEILATLIHPSLFPVASPERLEVYSAF